MAFTLLVDVVTFFFISVASRKSYLVQLGMRKRGYDMQESGEGEKATRFLRERWRACRRSRCTGDGGEVTNYLSLSAAPVFKARGGEGAHSTPGIKRHWASSSKALGIPRPSIHHKPAATMLTTSFRHVVEDLSRAKLKITLLSPPKSLWSIHCVCLPPSPACRRSFSAGEKIAVSVYLSRIHFPSNNFK